jgi:PilZ domain
MSDSIIPPSEGRERRVDERYFTCFPAYIQRPGGSDRMGLIHDLSVSGALILTRSRLQIGDPIRLRLYLWEDATRVKEAGGKVVRVEPRTGERAEVWHRSVAVQFDEPLADCEAEIKALEDHQARLGVPRD